MLFCFQIVPDALMLTMTMSGVNEDNFNDTKPILVETIASATNTTTDQVDAVFIGMVSASSRRDVQDKAEINVTVIPSDENE